MWGIATLVQCAAVRMNWGWTRLAPTKERLAQDVGNFIRTHRKIRTCQIPWSKQLETEICVHWKYKESIFFIAKKHSRSCQSRIFSFKKPVTQKTSHHLACCPPIIRALLNLYNFCNGILVRIWCCDELTS